MHRSDGQMGEELLQSQRFLATFYFLFSFAFCSSVVHCSLESFCIGSCRAGQPVKYFIFSVDHRSLYTYSESAILCMNEEALGGRFMSLAWFFPARKLTFPRIGQLLTPSQGNYWIARSKSSPVQIVENF
jgi:hypothetical protein